MLSRSAAPASPLTPQGQQNKSPRVLHNLGVIDDRNKTKGGDQTQAKEPARREQAI